MFRKVSYSLLSEWRMSYLSVVNRITLVILTFAILAWAGMVGYDRHGDFLYQNELSVIFRFWVTSAHETDGQTDKPNATCNGVLVRGAAQ